MPTTNQEQLEQSFKPLRVEQQVTDECFYALLEQFPMGIVICRDGKLLYANAAQMRMFGYAAAEPPDLVGRSVLAWVAPASRRQFIEYMNRASREETGSGVYEFIGRRQDGSEFLFQLNAKTIFLPDGPALLGFFTDVTAAKRAEKALESIVAGTAAATGIDFFQSLVRHLAAALQVRYALVARNLATHPPRVRTLALWARGDIVPNIEYDLAGTPCAQVYTDDFCYFPQDVQRLFPQDTVLVEWGVHSYAGLVLVNSSGEAIGHLAVLNDGPIGERQELERILRIFAARAGAELERQQVVEARERALAETSALLQVARDILEERDFGRAARSILDACKSLTGATAGYVALLSAEGTGKEVLFLDSDGRPRAVDHPLLSMPIRGLWETVYRTGQAVYENDFTLSAWAQYLPAGHAPLDNVLFAPLTLAGKVIGLLGLANKPGGFTPSDARIAAAFGELAAIALRNSRLLESLEQSEQRYRLLFTRMSDGFALHEIICDEDGRPADYRFLEVNPAFEKLTGLSAEQVVGRTVRQVLPDIEPFWIETFGRVALTGQPAALEQYAQALGRYYHVIAFSPRPGQFATLFSDITRRKEEEEMLARYSQELARSNAELERFAYVVSHDLQEPLRMVGSYAQLLARRYQGQLDAQADEFIGYMTDGVMRMQEMIQSLLVYSRVSTRKKPFAPTDCNAVVKRVLTTLHLTIQETGAVVTHDPLPTVLADEVQLGQLFQNLVGNALKFHGPAAPRVHITARQEGNEWVFAVQDNGIGIDPKYWKDIFDVFRRLHPREEYPGTGIGLAICKKIVERHGGRIWVESQPGEGATFYFTLPRGGD